MRILLIDDDKILVESLKRSLTECNYVVDAVFNGEQGWTYGSTYTYDLIILEMVLPDINGIDLCRHFRENDYQMPMLFLTAKNTSTDKIQALDAGADDYAVKPFNFEELNARIRVLLRRESGNFLSILYWGELQLNTCSQEVSYNGKMLSLTAKEYTFLELLLHHDRSVLDVNDIIEGLWNADEEPSPATVRSHLKSLRRKLQQAGAPRNFIETVRGQGYRLKTLPESERFPEPVKQAKYMGNSIKEPTKNLFKNPPLLLIIDDNSHFIESLESAAKEQGINIEIVLNPREIRFFLNANSQLLPDAALLKLSFLDSHPLSKHSTVLAERLSAISELSLRSPSLPIIAIGDRDTFADRLEVARRGGCFLLREPATPEQTIASIMPILQRSQIEYKVMIVDDDLDLLKSLPSLLHPWRFNLTTLDDSRQFWDVLQAIAPDLLVLDVEMPYISGIELCQVLRSHPYWQRLPVLFLTTHTDIETQNRAFASGADDFVNKPILGQELADRILNRLRRIQIYSETNSLVMRSPY
ncbi:response regulator [Spirulina sp. 06S082]|uniref:response regulator n=1 Tax=Spirulina sp. 06S082 TaxID=3110248 RepID=UPI002B1EF13C|nr:response regulator [Spirulina sp. 06S082]MEA5468107.1 response regulator [Spirulina sp. 06S082]